MHHRSRAHPTAVLRAFARRLWAALTVPRASVVVIEYELLPYFPALLERWLAWRGCRMVVDYDDALFHQYDAHPNKWVRRLLGRKIATVMRLAHTVVASPVGVNAEIVEEGGNGFLAADGAAWVKALETLRADVQARERMGAAGRRRVEERYCLGVTGERVVGVVRNAAAG